MKNLRTAKAALVAAAIAAGAVMGTAQIERLNLDQMVAKTDDAVLGEITKKGWVRGQISVPADILAELDRITPYEAFHNGGEDGGLTSNAWIHENLKELKAKHVVKLVRDIISEKHTRLAYSLSCLLMVTLGAVLGLIFRGGHFVSALFTATVPATTVIVTILMGKNIAQNPGVMSDDPYASTFLGVTIVWGGIVSLAVVTGLIYWRVSKK